MLRELRARETAPHPARPGPQQTEVRHGPTRIGFPLVCKPFTAAGAQPTKRRCVAQGAAAAAGADEEANGAALERHYELFARLAQDVLEEEATDDDDYATVQQRVSTHHEWPNLELDVGTVQAWVAQMAVEHITTADDETENERT